MLIYFENAGDLVFLCHNTAVLLCYQVRKIRMLSLCFITTFQENAMGMVIMLHPSFQGNCRRMIICSIITICNRELPFRQVYCIFLFLAAASLFGTIIAQVIFHRPSRDLWLFSDFAICYSLVSCNFYKFTLDVTTIFKRKVRITVNQVHCRWIRVLQVNEIVAQHTTLTKDLDSILEMYLGLTPRYLAVPFMSGWYNAHA